MEQKDEAAKIGHIMALVKQLNEAIRDLALDGFAVEFESIDVTTLADICDVRMLSATFYTGHYHSRFRPRPRCPTCTYDRDRVVQHCAKCVYEEIQRQKAEGPKTEDV